jgi:hypothetical protein
MTMTAEPRTPTERVIQIAAISDRFMALTSEGKIWITNRGSSLGWRPLALPPMNGNTPEQTATW